VLLPYLALLQVGFAMPSLLPSPRCALTAPFHPYRPSAAFTIKDLGGLFSVALSVGSRPPGVTWHLIRRSPDFPPSLCLDGFHPRSIGTAIARPAPRGDDSAAAREVNGLLSCAARNSPAGRRRDACVTRHRGGGAARRGGAFDRHSYRR